MKRPTKFEGHRYLGDKRTQFAYDLEAYEKEDFQSAEVAEVIIQELMESEQFLCFAPDTEAELRNRGYKLISF